MPTPERLAIGIPELDEHLGGGLLPGTLTVVAGATGIGKTQLGLHFANEGQRREGRRGVIFDMTARGDSQHHAVYARDLFGWELQALSAERNQVPEHVWQADAACEYLHIFDHSGRRVTRGDLEYDDWRAWKSELAQRLGVCIQFFYGAFVHGVRRAVVDGVEPVDRPGDSIQFELFEYIYHQILRKDADWVARDLFRERFRANEAQVAAHRYDPAAVACLLLYTTREVMLEDLVSRPLDQGDVLSGANTVILMGKIREGNRFGRALYIAKHRGSYCRDEVVPYQIDGTGISML
jgi:RecA/RadA recombinase